MRHITRESALYICGLIVSGVGMGLSVAVVPITGVPAPIRNTLVGAFLALWIAVMLRGTQRKWGIEIRRSEPVESEHLESEERRSAATIVLGASAAAAVCAVILDLAVGFVTANQDIAKVVAVLVGIAVMLAISFARLSRTSSKRSA